MRFLRIAALAFLFLLCGCGANNLPPVSSLHVTVTAAQSSISINQTTLLTATFSGTSDTNVGGWYVTETYNATQHTCAFGVGHQYDAAPGECPAGVITFDKNDYSPLKAMYYPPSTPGTYHVTYGVTIWDSYSPDQSEYVSAQTAVQVTN